MTSVTNVDICIVGAGMVGATLGLSLAQNNQRVVILESRKLTIPDSNQDERNTALGYGSRQLLERLGVWQALGDNISEINSVHVSQKGSFGVTRLTRETENLPSLGYLAPNHKIQSALHKLISEHSNIQLIDSVGELTIAQHDQQVDIHYSADNTQQKITSKLLLAADGSNSTVRSQCGIDAEITDYQSSAVIANVKASKFETGVAYERFTQQGPVALLPLATQEYSMVWSMSPEQAERVLALDSGEFLKQLQAHFGYRVGVFEAHTKRQAYPLRLLRSANVYSGRCLLIGNAAYTIHPVAGQGFNLALRDISFLSTLLKDVSDPGLELYLQQYEQQRKADVDRIVNFTDGLLRTFTNSSPLMAHARGAALAVLGQFPFLQRQVSRQGLGLFQHNLDAPAIQQLSATNHE